MMNTGARIALEEILDQDGPETLLVFLEESHIIYAGKSAEEVMRIRGSVMACFFETGLPDAALPFMLEELENARHPYLIAGAAMALRGAIRPMPQTFPFLLKAVRNLVHGDSEVCFDRLKPGMRYVNPTSGFSEIMKTLAWAGSYAAGSVADLKALFKDSTIFLSAPMKKRIRDTISAIEKKDPRAPEDTCCEIFQRKEVDIKEKKWNPENILLEDQDGKQLFYPSFFNNGPVILVFFYTRCDNPYKCSLTITKLGLLQRQLCEAGIEKDVKIAAVTYDPFFDEPFRLRNYCSQRGLFFSDSCHSFRVLEGFDMLRGRFELGVGYAAPSVVNKHTVELYITNRRGIPVKAFKRTGWDNEKVISIVKTVLKPGTDLKDRLKRVFRGMLSGILSLMIAFFPKCPLCLLAYMSAVGISSLSVVSFYPFILPLLLTLFLINSYVLYRRCKKRRSFLPLYLSACGTILLLSGRFLTVDHFFELPGIVLLMAGNLLNSLTLPVFKKFTPVAYPFN